MYYFFSRITFLIFFILTIFLVTLSTIGINTNKFNNFISKKINQENYNINLDLTSIKFKLDIKEVSLFFETENPKINYRSTVIPVQKLKVYVDFLSLLKSDPKIKKINLALYKLDINKIKKISPSFKPSNFTSFINNKIKKGKINTTLEIFFNNKNFIQNFIAKGTVSDFKIELTDDINLQNTSFSFFADKSDILFKNILSDTELLNISNGDLKLKLSPEIQIETNFKSNLKYNSNLNDFPKLIKKLKYTDNIINLEAKINNNLIINFDKTYKLKNFDYRNSGKILNAKFNLKKILENYPVEKKNNLITLINTEIKTSISPKNKIIKTSGKYILNKSEALLLNLESIIDKELINLKIEADIKETLDLGIINYKKPNSKIARFTLDLEKKKKE